MKKKIFISLIGLLLSLILSAHAFSLTLYDDFSGNYIDRTKWVYGEFVREINGGKLIFKHASPNPIAISSYPFYEFNMLSFSDPNSVVNSLQADVTILENNITNQAVTMARLAGAWYNDGTPGGGRIGDIVGVIHLRGDSTGLFAAWVVLKMTNVNGSTNSILGSGKFTTPIILGTAYTLYITYDVATNQFRFKVGTEEKTFGPGGLPTRVGNANSPGKDLGTRVDVYDSTSSSYISATFDNVYKNGALYDDFSSPIIDSTKWNSYEFVREISGGKLRTKVRTSSASNNEVNSDLPSIVPIKAAQAKVTLLDYQNPPGPYFRVGVGVGIAGAFYSDGTPGEGQIGDVQAEVQIIANEWSTLQPEWKVLRCAYPECEPTETLATGVFTTPIVLGNTYTLFMEWDGSQFTIKFNDEVARYTPTSSSINAAKLPFIYLNTEVNASPGHNKEATIEALYDEVMANVRVIAADFDRNGKTDVAAFHLPTDQFFVEDMGNLGQFGWGGSDSMPLIWDYDGDGKTDVSIYHIPTNQWFVKGVGNLGQYGWGGDDSVPVPGDYNGDGRMERAFYHSPTNQWFVEGQDPVQFGWNGAECIPVPGDYDGDGKTDMVIYHIPSNQWFQYGVGNLGQFGWGGADCIPVPGDYNGDGKTEIAVYHVPTNQWFVKGMGNLGQYGWGGLESFPIPGDYNGDGVMERGFYRPGSNRWFIEGETDFVWGWGGADFMPITSQIAVYNWFRFISGRFATYNIADYFPFSVGNQWNYTGGQTTITGTIQINNENVFVYKNTLCPCVRDDYFTVDERGMIYWGNTEEGIFPQPLFAFLPTWKIGEEKQITFTEQDKDILKSGTLSWKLERLEDVTTPAGQFKNCLRFSVSVSIQGEHYDHYKEVLHFARGIGPVRTQRTESSPYSGCFLGIDPDYCCPTCNWTQELVSAVINGINIP